MLRGPIAYIAAIIQPAPSPAFFIRQLYWLFNAVQHNKAYGKNWDELPTTPGVSCGGVARRGGRSIPCEILCWKQARYNRANEFRAATSQVAVTHAESRRGGP
jgi:hypothetical protein